MGFKNKLGQSDRRALLYKLSLGVNLWSEIKDKAMNVRKTRKKLSKSQYQVHKKRLKIVRNERHQA